MTMGPAATAVDTGYMKRGAGWAERQGGRLPNAHVPSLTVPLSPLEVASTAVDVRLLGPLEVEGDDGRIASLPGAKLRALVSLLAVDAGSVVSSDRLIESLYGDGLPARPANALALLVSKFRRALGDVEDAGGRLVLTQAPGYVLDLDRDRIDVFRFERLAAEGRRLRDDQPEEAAARLREALALWRGDALVDVAFQDLASVERVRLEELRIEAVEDRVDADLAVGRHSDLVAELERLTRMHPLRERLWGQLMVALYRCGRQADALRTYQEARRRLGEELGLEPGPALRRLEVAVLDQDPALDPHAPTTARPPMGNLPLPLTELVGRKQEVAAVRLLLGVHRLVTIVGPGGAGKTRLAVEVGRSMAEQVADGVWMIELAPVDGQAVVPTTAGVLGIEQVGTAGLRTLAQALSERELVIVLDNCEHVVGDAARMVHELLVRGPRVRVLATSREPLGVAGEHRFPLPPLDIDAAVELFGARVEAAGGRALLADGARRQQVQDLCARLDGLPLALELAASRAAHLDISDVAARLDDRFRLLAGGLHTAEPRQQTMRAVVDWSWELLDNDERLMFRRFSVFSGSASLAAAEVVCAGEGIGVEDVARLLARLADKSLVSLDRSGVTPRFVMLQTLVDYGRRRVAEAEEEIEVRRRHVRWVAEFVAEAEHGLRGDGQLRVLAQLVAELDNVRAAVTWATSHDPPLALEMAGRVGWFGYMTNQTETVWSMLTAALDVTPGETADRVLPLAFAAALGKMSGHLGEAETYRAEAEAAVTAGVPPSVVGPTLAILALADTQSGAVQTARAHLESARTCFAGASDRWWLGYVDLAQAVVALYDGRWTEAMELVDRSVATMRSLGDEWMASMALIPRAYLAERQGLLEDAAVALEQAVSAAKPFAEKISGSRVRLPLLGIARARLALVRSAQGRHADAVHLAGLALDEAGLGTGSAVAISHQARGRALLGLGRTAEGRDDLERAVVMFHELGVGIAVAESLVDLGRSWLEEGDASTAVARLERARTEAFGTEDRHTIALVLTALADAYAAAGDPAAASAVRSEAEARSD